MVNGNGNGRWFNTSTIISISGSILTAALIVGATYGSVQSHIDYQSVQLGRLEKADSIHASTQGETAVAMATLGTQLIETRALVTDLRAEIRELRQDIAEIRNLLYQTRREAQGDQ